MLAGGQGFTCTRASPAPGCSCHACASGFTRGYLRHLDRCNEMLGPMLGTLHNLRYYQRLMARMREAIDAMKELAPPNVYWYTDETGRFRFQPMPTTPTFLPGPMFQCLRGE